METETNYWDNLYYEKVLKYYEEDKSSKNNIHNPDWWRVWATKKDIENMTLEQAVEIVECLYIVIYSFYILMTIKTIINHLCQTKYKLNLQL